MSANKMTLMANWCLGRKLRSDLPAAGRLWRGCILLRDETPYGPEEPYWWCMPRNVQFSLVYLIVYFSFWPFSPSHSNFFSCSSNISLMFTPSRFSFSYHSISLFYCAFFVCPLTHTPFFSLVPCSLLLFLFHSHTSYYYAFAQSHLIHPFLSSLLSFPLQSSLSSWVVLFSCHPSGRYLSWRVRVLSERRRFTSRCSSDDSHEQTGDTTSSPRHSDYTCSNYH